ncbi:MAG: hypothetical protein QM718_10000 [Steroidobacteraceae bacterium]
MSGALSLGVRPGMFHFPQFFAALPGAFGGMILSMLLTRWLRLLFLASGKEPSGRPVPAQTRRWALIFTVVNPVPWLLVLGVAIGVRRALEGSIAAGWWWFWGFAVATPILVYIASYRAITKAIRARGVAGPNNALDRSQDG